MSPGLRSRPPRYLLVLFLGTTVVLLTSLAWLGWTSFQQDRAIEIQRFRDRLENAADLVAAEIRQNLIDLEAQLTRFSLLPEGQLDQSAASYASQVGDDALIAVFEAERVRVYPNGRLLYYPVLPVLPEPPVERFAAGDALEFKDQDLAGAISYFRQLSRSSDSLTRAGALVRLARHLKNVGQAAAALETYDALAGIQGVAIGGWPVELRARKAQCDLFEELKQTDQLKAAAERLGQDLRRGRWPITRPTFLFLQTELRRWLGADAAADRAARSDDVALALAASVDSLWERWQRDPSAMLINQGGPVSRERSVFSFSRGTPSRLVALVSGPGFLDRHVVEPLRGLLDRQGVGLVLADAEGQTLFSYQTTKSAQTAAAALRTMADTRLPWTLRVVSADPETDFAQLARRRWLLVGGLGFMALLAVAGSYFSVRAMTREIQAARLQSEFVAAVSHEFRTPLTSLRQFTDLLADGRVSNEDDRQKYYAALRRGTRRLTRLVENLLDFGRMEAGFYQFALESVPARQLVEHVSAEFSEEVRERGYTVEMEWSGPPDAEIQADEPALGRALWNLLDNAVKYSPNCKTIWMDVAAANGSVSIAVRDRGIGVPAEEQRTIFSKFVRGSTPGYTVKGTGLGLALVDQIVQAHGGKVKIESKIGEGSIFSIVLPASGGRA